MWMCNGLLCCTAETNATLEINYTPRKSFFKKAHSGHPSFGDRILAQFLTRFSAQGFKSLQSWYLSDSR